MGGGGGVGWELTLIFGTSMIQLMTKSQIFNVPHSTVKFAHDFLSTLSFCHRK